MIVLDTFIMLQKIRNTSNNNRLYYTLYSRIDTIKSPIFERSRMFSPENVIRTKIIVNRGNSSKNSKIKNVIANIQQSKEFLQSHG